MKSKLILLSVVCIAAGIFFLSPVTSFAVTATPDPVSYTQPDGSRLTIMLRGDELIHWAETSDGYTIMTNRDGFYEYASRDRSGKLIFSGIRANDPANRGDAEQQWLRNTAKGLFFSETQVLEMRARLRNPGDSDAPLTGGFPTTGTRKLLMILANFNNTTTTYSQTNFNNYMNQVNYNSTGSFRDYYLEVSYGQLTVNTTVTVWVTLPNTHDYYGPDTYWGQFAYDAVVAANNQAGVNYAEYDNNLDGTVDGVAIIHQGRGQEESGNVNDIWSHSWELSSAGYSYSQRTFDGVQVESYTTMPERNATGMGTIGVMCHEFGHNLGSPDFYDTDYSTNGSYTGTGKWDLMAGGSWNGSSGTKPAHPNAWIKAFFNWSTPVVLSSAQAKTLRNAQVYPDVIRYNTTTANEYFLCENRQQTGFDAGIPGHGLIIYHVDGNYISSHTSANNINTGSHQGLYPVCASASGNPPSVYGTINGTGCPYPGTGNKTTFTDATTPHSKSWAGANTGFPLTTIAENTTTKEISFCFISCTAAANPASFAATPFSASQINLAWTPNAAANPVMVAFNTSATFGTPVTGTSYTAGNTIPGGGTVLYNGTAASFSHTGLTANTTYYYKAWSVGTGANYSTGLTANATTPCAIYYPVSVTIAASANPVCAGTAVTFTATPVNGGSTPAYQWKVNGFNIQGATGQSYTFAPAQGNTIQCVLTSNAACTTGNPASSNIITMTVNPLLIPGSVSASQSICANTRPLELNGIAPSNGTNPVYQWQSSLDNNSFTNLNGATMLNYQPRELSVTTYFRQIQDATGTCGGPLPTNSLTITVNPPKPVSVTISASANPVCSGTSVTFNATPVNGGSLPLYQWMVNGMNAGSNSPNFTYVPVNGEVVSCQLTSNEICPTGNPAISNAITMTVNPLKPVSVTIAGSANPVCAGTSVTFTATPVNGGSLPVYQWRVNGLNAGSSSPNFTYVPVNGEVVTCQLTSNETCPTGNPAISNAITMTVNPLKPVSVTIAGSANPVCAGTAVTFTATPVNGGSLPVYQWMVNGLNAGSNSPNFTYVPVNGEVVTCQLTSNEICPTGNPATSNAITMTVNPLKPVSVTIAGSANPVCAGTSVTFTATPVNGGSLPLYQWMVNGVNAGTNSPNFTYVPVNGEVVTCQLLSNEICPTGNPATSNAITMTVNPLKPVSVTIAGSANPVCAGTAVTFTATPVNGGSLPLYQWMVNGLNAGSNSPNFTYVPVNGEIITCQLTSNEICPTGNPAISNAITMTVNPLKPVSVTIAGSANPVCAGTAVTFTATPVNGGSLPLYQWMVNGLNAGTNSPNFTYVPVNGEVITCQLTSNEICPTGNPATSNAITVTVIPTLNPGSVSASHSICAGALPQPLNGTAPSNGSNPVYQWQSSLDNNTFTNINGATNSVYQPGDLDVTTYFRQMQNASGTCGGPLPTNSVTITVNPLRPVSVTIAESANPVCAGTAVTFTATPVNGGSLPLYQWMVNGLNAGTNSPNFTYVPVNGEVVTCQLLSNEICPTGNPAISNAITMTVNPLKPVSVTIAGSANPVCAGTSVTFTATPVNGGSLPLYQWMVNGLNTGSNSPNFTYVPVNGEVVTCQLLSNEICPTGNPATSNAITMTVNPLKPVSVTIAGSANPVCAGTAVTFTATPVNGGSLPLYQWMVNGLNAGSNSPNFTYVPVNGEIITCQLTSNEICPTGNPATSNAITMTVNPLKPVSVTIAESANPVCAGTAVTFTATPVNGGSLPLYQWRVNGLNTGTNSPDFTYVPVNGEVVTCQLTSNEICPTGNPATSNAITMTVNPLKPVSATIAESANPVCAGTSVTFTATPVNGGSLPLYQWRVNGVNTGTNSPNFTYVPVNGEIVTCQLTSNEICPTGNPATSNAITMTVNPLKPVSVTIAGSANPVCAGTAVTFTATPVNGGSLPLYQWMVNGVNAGSSSPIFTYVPVNGEVVTCQLTSNEICPTGNPATSNAITMTVNPLKPVSVNISGSANPVCAGTAVTFTATPVNGGSLPLYQWMVNGLNAGSNSPTFTYVPVNGEIITCQLTSNEICPTGNPATSNAITMTVNPLKPVSVTIAESANPVCAGTSVTFTATPVNGGSLPLYQWRVNGVNTGTNSPNFTYVPVNGEIVTCQLTSNEICPTGNPATSNAITMTVNPLKPVSVTIAGSANPVCAGTAVTFTATPVNGGSLPLYQWMVNGVNAGSSSPIFTYVPVNGEVVTCQLTSNEICPTGNPATSNAITMTVNPLKPVSVNISGSANPVCAGTAVTFTATPVNGGSLPLYQWMVNGLNAGSNSPTFTYVPVNGEIITCQLTSNEICPTGNPATSNAITMTVNPLKPVSVTINVSANPVQSGTPVTFTATPVNGGTTPTFQWFVNGKSAGTNSPAFTYTPNNGETVSCQLTSNAVCATGNPATSNTIVMTVITIPAVNTLQNLNLTGIHCYDALQTILVAGSGTTFTVQNGARVTLIAGQRIRLLAGTKVKPGGYLRGYIAPSGPFCSLTPSLPAITEVEETPLPIREGSFFRVYPNPTRGEFTLELQDSSNTGTCHVEIFTMTGSRQLSVDLQGSGKYDLSLDDNPAGIYFIRVISAGRSGTVKILKQP